MLIVRCRSGIHTYELCTLLTPGGRGEERTWIYVHSLSVSLLVFFVSCVLAGTLSWGLQTDRYIHIHTHTHTRTHTRLLSTTGQIRAHKWLSLLILIKQHAFDSFCVFLSVEVGWLNKLQFPRNYCIHWFVKNTGSFCHPCVSQWRIWCYA